MNKKALTGIISLVILLIAVAATVITVNNTKTVSDKTARSALYDYLYADEKNDKQLNYVFSSYTDSLEYLFLDVTGDGIEELLVQCKNDPGQGNALFHYNNGEIECWNEDFIEATSFTYPLLNSNMVYEYNYGGMVTTKVFRYLPDGTEEDIIDFFVRQENVYNDPSLKCPYYEIDDIEVEEAEFTEKYKSYVSDHLIPNDMWTAYDS